MIRHAAPADRIAAIRLMKAAHAHAGFGDANGLSGFVVPFDAATMERLFLHHVTAPDALALIYAPDGNPSGLLLAAASEHPFGPVKVAKDTLWWIDKAHRGGGSAARMLDDYESWAFGEQGCTFAGMAGMGEDPDVAVLYRRRGYRVAETHFLKPLKAT